MTDDAPVLHPELRAILGIGDERETSAPERLRNGPPRDEKQAACFHRQRVVCASARTMECADCGASLDPIAILSDIAHDADWVVALRAERKKLEADVETLRAQASSTRAKVRRGERAWTVEVFEKALRAKDPVARQMLVRLAEIESGHRREEARADRDK
jgi:hypothetical protein